MPNNDQNTFEIHSLLNIDRCLARTAFPDFEPDMTDEAWLDKLMTHCNRNQSVQIRKSTFDFHFGVNAEYTHKTTLEKYFRIIAAALDDNLPQLRLDDDQKLTIIEKMREACLSCTPGSTDRIKPIIVALKQPNNLPELMTRFRINLVESAANVADEVHSHQDFYVMANAIGLGIPHDGIVDPHRGENFSAEDIQTRLQEQFLDKFTPSVIISEIWNNVFHDFGYRGYKNGNEFYFQNEYIPILNFLRVILAKRNLKIQDCFLLENHNDEPIVRGINWVYIDSLLIKHLEAKQYLYKTSRASSTKTYVFNGATLQLDYIDNDLDNARIRYSHVDHENNTIVRHSFLGVRHGNETVLRQQIPAELLDQFILDFFSVNNVSLNVFPQLLSIAQGDTRKTIIQSFAKMKLTRDTDFYLIVNFIASLNASEWQLHADMIKSKLIMHMSNSNDFRQLQARLDLEKKSIMYHLIRDIIHEHTHNIDDFCNIAVSLNQECLQDFLSINTFNMYNIFRSNEDIKRILSELSDASLTIIYEEAYSIFNVMRISKEFGYAISSLSPMRIIKICQIFDKELPYIIHNVNALEAITRQLSYDQKKALLTGLADKIAKIIPTVADLCNYFQYNVTSVDLIYAAIKKWLPKMITSSSEFYEVTSWLNDKDRSECYMLVEHLLPQFIHANQDVVYILSPLPNAECQKACIKLKALLVTHCKQLDDIRLLLRSLKHSNYPALLPYEKLYSLITNERDFIHILWSLSNEQRKEFYHYVFQCKDNNAYFQHVDRFHELYTKYYQQTWTLPLFNPDFSANLKANIPRERQWDTIVNAAIRDPSSLVARALESMYCEMRVAQQQLNVTRLSSA